MIGHRVWAGIGIAILSMLLLILSIWFFTMRPHFLWREHTRQVLYGTMHPGSTSAASVYESIPTVIPAGADLGCGDVRQYKVVLYSDETIENIKQYHETEFRSAGWGFDNDSNDHLIAAIVDSNTRIFIYDAPFAPYLNVDILLDELELARIRAAYQSVYLMLIEYVPGCWLARHLPHPSPTY